MDVPRSQSDGDEDAYAVYERYSATFASQPWFNEAAPLADSPSQGAPSGAGAGTSKKVPRRKENYSKQQDLLLCSAFLNVSRDTIVATNQSADTYWSRIHQYFQLHNTGPSRSRESVQHRWGTIQKDVSKFCSFKAEQDRLNRSGKTEADRITDALKAFPCGRREGVPVHPLLGGTPEREQMAQLDAGNSGTQKACSERTRHSIVGRSRSV